MATVITGTEFSGRSGVGDWRYLLGRIEATFRASSFEAATALALDVAHAADAAGHHPDLDVRYPDRLHVVLTTHAAGGQLTEADLSLAATITELAEASGATSDPLAAQTYEVAIDAMDIDAVRPFWQAVLGYVPEPPREDTQEVVALVDPARIGPAFWFQQMDAPRPQRNRIHIDVTVPPEVAEQRVADAIAAGGTLLTDEYAKSFWVLADPEGNEACVCTWQDRD